jgi:hypothetical protein
LLQLRIREEDIMSCPYYKEGFLGVLASESTLVPNIEKWRRFVLVSVTDFVQISLHPIQ